jgi:hypothetical protein
MIPLPARRCPRVSRNGAVSWFTSISGMTLTFLACSPTSRPAGGADASPPEVRIVRPAAGSTVADSVAVEVEAQDGGGIASVALWAGDAILGLRVQPPWIFWWNTEGLPDSSLHALEAIATDLSGNAALAPPCPVCVRANGPPAVSLLWPRDRAWIDLDRTGLPWRCRAQDPDEGSLPAERIRWSVDGAGLDHAGEEIAAPLLSPGRHHVRVEATDGWGVSRRAECTLTAFRYPGWSGPEEAVESFLCALQAGDSAVALGTLAADFRACLAPGPIPEVQDHALQCAGLAALLDPAIFRTLELAVRRSPGESILWNGRELAKVELRELSITLTVDCPLRQGFANDMNSQAQSPFYISDSGARLILCRNQTGDAAGAWRILTWWDLHGATWSRGGGISWTELVRLAATGRLCP